MLFSVTRKICPLLSSVALLFTCSCGKKAAEEGESVVPNIERQLPNPIFVQNLSSTFSRYVFAIFGSVNPPQKLRVNSGDTKGKTVTIFYDVKPEGGWGNWDVRCLYKGSLDGLSMNLTKCYDSRDADLGPVDRLLDMDIYVDKGHGIEMKTEAEDLNLDAIYKATWSPDQ